MPLSTITNEGSLQVDIPHSEFEWESLLDDGWLDGIGPLDDVSLINEFSQVFDTDCHSADAPGIHSLTSLSAIKPTRLVVPLPPPIATSTISPPPPSPCMECPATDDTSAKRDYRLRVAIPRYLRKRKTRKWHISSKYSTRTVAAKQRPRHNG